MPVVSHSAYVVRVLQGGLEETHAAISSGGATVSFLVF